MHKHEGEFLRHTQPIFFPCLLPHIQTKTSAYMLIYSNITRLYLPGVGSCNTKCVIRTSFQWHLTEIDRYLALWRCDDVQTALTVVCVRQWVVWAVDVQTIIGREQYRSWSITHWCWRQKDFGVGNLNIVKQREEYLHWSILL